MGNYLGCYTKGVPSRGPSHKLSTGALDPSWASTSIQVPTQAVVGSVQGFRGGVLQGAGARR